jgi:hypothetical protein
MRGFLVAFAAAAAAVSTFPADAAKSPEMEERRAPAPRVASPRFVENAGQWDPGVAFAARGVRRDALFRKGSVTLVERDGAAVALSFPGRAAPRGDARGRAQFTWFRGRDAAAHPMHAGSFASVVYDDAWPGVALRFDARPAAVEYSLVVAPGADAGAARLRIDGAERVEARAPGDLAVTTTAGTLTHSAPRAWQEQDGVRTAVRVAFDVREAADGAWTVGFDVDDHDPARPLVIDPTFEFEAHTIGLAGNDQLEDLATDPAGNVYVVGRARTPGAVPDSVPSFQRTPASFYDAFVAKLDPHGELVYATFLGGSAQVEYEEYEYAVGVAVDAEGQAIVGGYTYSDDFPMLAGPSTAAGPQATTFVSKLSADGGSLVFSGFIEGTSFGNGAGLPRIGVATDSDGAAYLCGFTYGDVPVTTQLGAASGPSPSAWVAKVEPDGGVGYLLSFEGEVGSYAQMAHDVAVGPDGAAYVCGTTSGAASLPPAATQTLAYGGGTRDAFVAKVNPAGTALDYAAYVGGDQSDFGWRVEVDASGAAYLLGSSSSSLETFPRDRHRTGGEFYAKLAPSGAALEYAGVLGLGGTLRSSIDIDSSGRVYVAGGSDVYRIAADGASVEDLEGTYTEAPLAIVADDDFWTLSAWAVIRVFDVSVAVPTSVEAHALSQRSVRVSWLPPDGALSFVVQRAAANGPVEDAATLDAPTFFFVDEGLEPDTEYRYRVLARRGLAESPASAFVTVRTEPSLRVHVQRASFVDRVGPRRDDVKLVLSLRSAQGGRAPAFDPLTDRMRVAVGDDLVLTVPAGDAGWAPHRGAWRWTGPFAAGTATLRIDTANRRATMRLRDVVLSGVPGEGDRVQLRIGDEAGSDVAGWQRSTRAVVR